MKERIQKVVELGTNIITESKTANNPKRKLLVNRAKQGLRTFEVAMLKLSEDI